MGNAGVNFGLRGRVARYAIALQPEAYHRDQGIDLGTYAFTVLDDCPHLFLKLDVLFCEIVHNIPDTLKLPIHWGTRGSALALSIPPARDKGDLQIEAFVGIGLFAHVTSF